MVAYWLPLAPFLRLGGFTLAQYHRDVDERRKTLGDARQRRHLRVELHRQRFSTYRSSLTPKFSSALATNNFDSWAARWGMKRNTSNAVLASLPRNYINHQTHLLRRWKKLN